MGKLFIFSNGIFREFFGWWGGIFQFPNRNIRWPWPMYTSFQLHTWLQNGCIHQKTKLALFSHCREGWGVQRSLQHSSGCWNNNYTMEALKVVCNY